MEIDKIDIVASLPVEEKVKGYRKFLYNYISDNIRYYHLGRDYGGYVGDEVKSTSLPGTIVFAGNIQGFGALAPKKEPGGVVIIKHKLIDEEFYIVYGHLNISPNINVGLTFDKPIMLGTLNSFKNYGLDGKTIVVLPHCHNGIWLSNKPIEGNLGYDTEIRYWIDPDKFYANPKEFYYILKNNNSK